MNVETLELDLGKRPGSEPTVFCRKGEKGALTLRATIADHGAEVDLSAFGVFFDCVTPDGRLVSDEATSKEGSTAVCTLNGRRWRRRACARRRTSASSGRTVPSRPRRT